MVSFASAPPSADPALLLPFASVARARPHNVCAPSPCACASDASDDAPAVSAMLAATSSIIPATSSHRVCVCVVSGARGLDSELHLQRSPRPCPVITARPMRCASSPSADADAEAFHAATAQSSARITLYASAADVRGHAHRREHHEHTRAPRVMPGPGAE